MIDQSTYTRDWVNSVSNNYGHSRRKVNPLLIEKVTQALHLLKLSTETNLNYIFNGGRPNYSFLIKCTDFLAHYKLFYNSVIDDAEGYVLLDILFEKNKYLSL